MRKHSGFSGAERRRVRRFVRARKAAYLAALAR